jgi:hypothetical protein
MQTCVRLCVWVCLCMHLFTLYTRTFIHDACTRYMRKYDGCTGSLDTGNWHSSQPAAGYVPYTAHYTSPRRSRRVHDENKRSPSLAFCIVEPTQVIGIVEPIPFLWCHLACECAKMCDGPNLLTRTLLWHVMGARCTISLHPAFCLV